MLSKPLAPPSVFGSVNKRVWGPIVSAPRQKNPPSDCSCRQIERLWFFFFSFLSEVGPFHYHPLISCARRWACVGCFWQQILVRAVIITPTVPEHAGAAVDTKCWAAPGVWTKLRKTRERKKCSHLSTYPHHEYKCFISQARTREFTHLNNVCVLSFKVYVHEKRKAL